MVGKDVVDACSRNVGFQRNVAISSATVGVIPITLGGRLWPSKEWWVYQFLVGKNDGKVDVNYTST